MAFQPIHRRIKYVIGIDEAGRGPLAGPFYLGAVMMPRDFYMKYRLLNAGKNFDSKSMSEARREKEFAKIKDLRGRSKVYYVTCAITAGVIDRRGIAWASRVATGRALARLCRHGGVGGLRLQAFNTPSLLVLLDGGLKAPERYIYQKTILKGDSHEPIVGMASIVAKVTRDKYMKRKAKLFSKYNFEFHKGYGTKAHYKAIKKHGLCPLHRRSFLTDFDYYDRI